MSKALRPAVAISWEYAKTEIVPPLTQAFFKGPGGRAIEASCGTLADIVMGIMQHTIKGIDEAEARQIAQKAAQEKAKLEKMKAEAEAKRKQAEEATKVKAAEEAKAAAKAPEPKKAEEKKAEAKKTETIKAKAEKPAPKKPEPKKK